MCSELVLRIISKDGDNPHHDTNLRGFGCINVNRQEQLEVRKYYSS